MAETDTFVSVVAPLHDDGDIIEGFVREVMEVLTSNYANFELLLVDDGSRDDTPLKVDALLKTHKCMRYIRLSRQFGVDVVVTAGLDSVIGDFAVVMLPDSDPPALIPELVRRARTGSGVVYGVRTSREGEPWWARAGASLFYGVARKLFDVAVQKDAGTFQVLSRQVVNGITRIKDKHRSLRLLGSHVSHSGDGVEYQPLRRRPHPRRRGFLESMALAAGLIVSSSTRPLRYVSALGLCASAVNLLYMGYVVAIYLFKRTVAEGWTTMSLQMSAMFFLVFLILAVISEYVGRNLEESRDRPLYHVLEERSSNVLVADAERRNIVTDSVAQ